MKPALTRMWRSAVTLTCVVAPLGGALAAANPAAAATGSCPSSIRASSDRICLYTSDSHGSWVALHAYTGSDGHDYVWGSAHAENEIGDWDSEIAIYPDACSADCGVDSRGGTTPGNLQIYSFGNGAYDGPGMVWEFDLVLYNSAGGSGVVLHSPRN